jgi:hypothetical protein
MADVLARRGYFEAIRSRKITTIIGLGLSAVFLSGCGGSNGEASPINPSQDITATSTEPPKTTESANPSPSETASIDPLAEVLKNYVPDSSFPTNFKEAKHTLETNGIADYSAVLKAIETHNPAYFKKNKFSLDLLQKNEALYTQLIAETAKLKPTDSTIKQVIDSSISTYQATRLAIQQILNDPALAGKLPQSPIILSGKEYDGQKNDGFMFALARPTKSDILWGQFNTSNPTDEAIFATFANGPASGDPELTKAVNYATFITASCAASLAGYNASCDLGYYTSRS